MRTDFDGDRIEHGEIRFDTARSESAVEPMSRIQNQRALTDAAFRDFHLIRTEYRPATSLCEILSQFVTGYIISECQYCIIPRSDDHLFDRFVIHYIL